MKELGSDRIHRFTYFERVLHWIVGLSFLYLLLTGLAFSHPRLYWITTVLGGGPTVRVLHAWIGVAFAVSAALMFAIWASEMRLDASDRAWLKTLRRYVMRQKEGVPPAGKYNGGQKVFFWGMTAFAVVFLLTGIPLWMPDGVFGLGPFYGTIVNVSRLIHYLTTVAGGLLFIVHVYLATVAYPGTLGAMLHGSVTRSWAKLHHPLWHNEQSGS